MWHWIIRSVPMLADFPPFLPSSSLCGAAVKPRRSLTLQSKCHSISERSTEIFTEVEKGHPTLRSGVIEGSHFSGFINYVTFGALGGYPIHVSESSSMSGKSLLSMLDMPVFTACENMDSTLREEPPKTVTFYENLGRLCSIDDPDRNRSIAWETMESNTTAYLDYPGVLRIKKKHGSQRKLNSDPCGTPSDESEHHLQMNMSHGSRLTMVTTNCHQA